MQTTRPVTKPTKQRKMMYNAPGHIRHKLLAAHLSAELRATHLVKSFPVRSGDAVRVVRGDHKGFEGKISRIDLKKFRIYLEGLTREKVDGTTIFVAVHPSKILITRLNLDDKWRKRVLERKQKTKTKPKEARKKVKPEAVQPESVELKAPVKEELEKPSEEEKQAPAEIESKIPAPEVPAEEEKAEAVKSPTKKASAKRKRTTRATPKKAKTQPAEEKESEPEPKKPRRKSNKKSDEGDV